MFRFCEHGYICQQGRLRARARAAGSISNMLSTTCSFPLLYSSESSLVNFRYAGFSASCLNSNSSFGTWRSGKNGKSATCKIKSHAKMAKSEMDADRINAVPADAGNSSSSFLSFLCPLLKLVGGGDPSGERNDMLEIVTSSLSSLARLPWGSKSLLESSRTQSAAENYSTRVREAMTELDLSVEVYPCPKGSLRHREIVRNIGGKEQFPFLVDSNTGRSMYESGEIVKYLFYQYGHGRKPSFGLLESTIFTGWVPTILRAGRGMTLWPRAKPEPPLQKLEFFSYENNLYARIVREALCELEIPYILRNVGEGSSNSELLLQTSGSNEVPYLVDPNTSTELGNHKKILSYLFQTYSTVN